MNNKEQNKDSRLKRIYIYVDENIYNELHREAQLQKISLSELLRSYISKNKAYDNKITKIENDIATLSDNMKNAFLVLDNKIKVLLPKK
jgi:predicted CopG family antitoxin